MKTFIFSIFLFSLIVSLIIANSLYVHRICKDMTMTAQSADLPLEEKARYLCQTWDANKPIFSFSIHGESIDRMDDLTQGLKSAIADGDRAEINKQIFLIQELLEKFSKTEEISLQGII